MVNWQRVSRQKYLIVSNLNEVFQKFKEIFPEIEIGFSKFVSLRPKEYVLAEASGTHSVYVCTLVAKLVSLTTEWSHPLRII